MASPRMPGHGSVGLEPPDSSDTHLSYLHCNRCGFCAHSVSLNADEGRQTTTGGETQLFVAQCSHLLCFNCLNPPLGFDGRSSIAHTCPLCNATSAIVRLDDQIPPDVVKIIAPCMEGLENAIEVAKFQFGNAVALIQYLKTGGNTHVDMLKSAIKTHVENSLAQTKRIQTLTSENESLKQEVASLQHKLASQQLLHQQQPHRHASTPQPKAHLPAATPLFSVPPPMKPKHLQHQQQHHPLSFQQDQPEQNFQHQLRQSSSQQNSPQENFSRHYMQTIPPFSPSQTPLSIPHISKVSSRAATPAPINRVNIRTTPHASSSLRQQHIQTPIPPARLSLPRPGSAMSGTSGPGSVSSLSPRGSMNQFQNTSSMRPSSNGSSGSHAPFRSSAPPQTMQGRISNTPMQGAASLPSTMHGHAPSAMQQATYARQGSQQPMQASFARQGAQPPLQQRNASSVPVDQQRRDGDMVIDVDLDDADAFQRQKRMTQQQQQQRPASVATGGRERVSRSLGGVGKTVLNRGGFNAASGGAAGPAVARSRGSSVGGREFGSGRAATPQVYSTR